MLVSRFDQSAPHVPKQGVQRLTVKVAQAAAGQNDNIQIAQFSTVMPEGLTCHAFDLVTVYGTPDIFFGYDQTQPCMLLLIESSEQQQTGS